MNYDQEQYTMQEIWNVTAPKTHATSLNILKMEQAELIYNLKKKKKTSKKKQRLE